MSDAGGADRAPPRGRGWIAPVALIGLALVIVPLSAVAALPGERTVKGWFGLDYAKACGDTRGRGPAGAWRELPPLGEARDELRAVAIGGSAYVVGGVARRGGKLTTVRTFERYDLHSGKRTPLAPLPVPLNHAGVATYRGDVYVVGGAGDDLNITSDRFWRYGVRNRRWTELPPMPSRRAAMAAAVAGDKLYAVGGNDGGVSTALAEAYDFRTRRWTKLASLPTPADHLSAASWGGAVYVAGGRRNTRNVSRAFYVFDADVGAWTRLPDLPEPMSGDSLNVVSGRLVVSGSENPPEGYLTGGTYAFQPAERRWEKLPFMSRPRHGHAGVGAGGRLYVLGGSHCPGKAAGIDWVDSLVVPAR